MPETREVEAVAPRGTGTASSRGTVYIVQSTDSNLRRYQAAEYYGNLVPIMERDAFPDNSEERMDKMREVMKAVLAKFNPAKDYVLLTGDPLAIAMCILTLTLQATSKGELKTTTTIRCQCGWKTELANDTETAAEVVAQAHEAQCFRRPYQHAAMRISEDRRWEYSTEVRIPCLKWDRDEQSYYPVVVSV